MNLIHARVALQQRVLPEYRAVFFDALASACQQGLSVFAGSPRSEEAISTVDRLQVANLYKASNWHLSRGRTYLCWQRSLLAWLRRWDPDVLIVEANPRYISTPLAMGWMHKRRRPVIGWGLGALSSSGTETLLRNRFFKQLDAIIAYSKTGAEQYIAAGVPADRVFVAPNAVTPAPIISPIERPPRYKEDKPSVLFIGRLQSRKRVDSLICACATLPVELQPNLVIIGDGPERSVLERLAFGLYPNTIFAGAKHGSELEPYFTQADLFVLPGSGGLAVQQAMTYSLPVIVGEADGTQRELVRPDNGWVLQNSSVDLLGSTLRTALSDISMLRLMGAESHRIVSEEVNTDKMVESFAKAIRYVLTK